MEIKIHKLTDTALTPTVNNTLRTSYDIYSDRDVILRADILQSVSTGIRIEIPKGYVGIVTGLSDLTKNSVFRVNTDIIQHGQERELIVISDILPINLSVTYRVREGDKVAQLLVVPVEPIELKEV